MAAIRLLSAEDVRAALPMREAIAAVRRAFADLQRGEAVMPLRSHLDIAAHQGVALFMPAFLPATGSLGIKAITLFDRNPAMGLPRIQALMLVFDAATGTPKAVMDAAVLTAIRTGAGSGLATDLLAPSDAASAAVFGAGVQGRTQLEAVCCVRPVRRAYVVDPDRAAAERFAQEMGARLGLGIEVAATPAEALQHADIVCTATVSSTPVFDDADLRPGTHINAIGSYKPHVQEIPSATVARARVVLDHRESALAETGDLLIPIAQGLFSAERIHGELGELILGRKPGRQSAEDITLYKAVGIAVLDLAAAAAALDRAADLGLGTEVAL